MSLENRGLIRFAVGGEHRAVGATSKPKGILQIILKNLEMRGMTRAQIKDRGVHLELLEEQFDKIYELGFQKLLNADHFCPLQIIVIEAGERHPPGVPIDSRDPGTMLGRF